MLSRVLSSSKLQKNLIIEALTMITNLTKNSYSTFCPNLKNTIKVISNKWVKIRPGDYFGTSGYLNTK